MKIKSNVTLKTDLVWFFPAHKVGEKHWDHGYSNSHVVINFYFANELRKLHEISLTFNLYTKVYCNMQNNTQQAETHMLQLEN